MAKKLYVGNLSYNATQDQVQSLFSQAGEVESVTLINDRETGRPKGFGFVEMVNEEGAQEAIKRFNGYSFLNRALNVTEARPREERPRREFNNAGSNSGGDREQRPPRPYVSSTPRPLDNPRDSFPEPSFNDDRPRRNFNDRNRDKEKRDNWSDDWGGGDRRGKGGRDRDRRDRY